MSNYIIFVFELIYTAHFGVTIFQIISFVFTYIVYYTRGYYQAYYILRTHI